MAAIVPAVAVGIAAGSQAQLMLNDGVNQLVVGEANYLRDGEPESIVGQIGIAVGRHACRLYAAGVNGLTATKAEKYERACRPYLNANGYGPGQGLKLPYRGGQCAAQYEVPISGTSPVGVTGDGQCSGVRDFNQTLTAWGPISDISLGRQVCSGGGGGGGKALTLTAFSVVGGPQLAEPITTETGLIAYTLNVGTPVRVDGLGDDCGNPPPEVIPTGDEPNPTPSPEPINPRPDLDIDLEIELTNEGDIVFNIGTGPITIDPFPDSDGDGGGGGGDGGSGAPPGDVGDPGDPESADDEGDAEGEAPEDKVLVGLRVEILEAPPSRNRYTDEVLRGAYYVYMGVPGLLDHDPAGAMATADQFIFAEQPNLTAWRVRANRGYTTRVTPYYRDPL